MLSIKNIKTLKFKIQCFKCPWLTYDMYIEKYTLSDDSVYIPLSEGCDFSNNSNECQKCCTIVTRMFRNGYSHSEGNVLKLDHSLFPEDSK